MVCPLRQPYDELATCPGRVAPPTRRNKSAVWTYTAKAVVTAFREPVYVIFKTPLRVDKSWNAPTYLFWNSPPPLIAHALSHRFSILALMRLRYSTTCSPVLCMTAFQRFRVDANISWDSGIVRWIPLQRRHSLKNNFICLILILKWQWELRMDGYLVATHRILSAPASSCSISGWTTMQECRRMEDVPTETWEAGCSCSLLFPLTRQRYHII